MLGGFISDLQAGDEFEPVRYTLTSLMTSEYAHGVEDDFEWFQSDQSPWGRQVCIPTLVHADKMRILEVNCPKEARIAGMRGPNARIHYEYHARHHRPSFVGDERVVSGRIADRFVKRGRTFLRYEMEVRGADGELVTEYWDQTLLKYAKDDESD